MKKTHDLSASQARRIALAAPDATPSNEEIVALGERYKPKPVRDRA